MKYYFVTVNYYVKENQRYYDTSTYYSQEEEYFDLYKFVEDFFVTYQISIKNVLSYKEVPEGEIVNARKHGLTIVGDTINVKK